MSVDIYVSVSVSLQGEFSLLSRPRGGYVCACDEFPVPCSAIPAEAQGYFVLPCCVSSSFLCIIYVAYTSNYVMAEA